MKKKSIIFLIIGIVLLSLGILFVIIGINNKYTINKYDFIKTHNMEKKTKISFPIYDNFIANDIYNDDFTRIYSSDDEFSLIALVNDKNESLEKYINNQYNENSNLLKKDNKKIDSNNVECEYTCKRYKVYKNDGTLISDELKIYIESSSNEVFEISYSRDKKELPSRMINSIINNITLDNDAKYKLGSINNNKLSIDLMINANKTLFIELDSEHYKEMEDRNNSERATIVKDNETQSLLTLTIRYNNSGKKLNEFINNFYNYGNEPVEGEEIKLDHSLFYKYNFDGKLYYAHSIDDKCAFVIEVAGEMITTKDFDNMKIIDKEKN